MERRTFKRLVSLLLCISLWWSWSVNISIFADEPVESIQMETETPENTEEDAEKGELCSDPDPDLSNNQKDEQMTVLPENENVGKEESWNDTANETNHADKNVITEDTEKGFSDTDNSDTKEQTQDTGNSDTKEQTLDTDDSDTKEQIKKTEEEVLDTDNKGEDGSGEQTNSQNAVPSADVTIEDDKATVGENDSSDYSSDPFEQIEKTDGIVITVTAEAGVFTADAELEIKKIENQDIPEASESALGIEADDQTIIFHNAYRIVGADMNGQANVLIRKETIAELKNTYPSSDVTVYVLRYEESGNTAKKINASTNYEYGTVFFTMEKTGVYDLTTVVRLAEETEKKEQKDGSLSDSETDSGTDPNEPAASGMKKMLRGINRNSTEEELQPTEITLSANEIEVGQGITVTIAENTQHSNYEIKYSMTLRDQQGNEVASQYSMDQNNRTWSISEDRLDTGTYTVVAHAWGYINESYVGNSVEATFTVTGGRPAAPKVTKDIEGSQQYIQEYVTFTIQSEGATRTGYRYRYSNSSYYSSWDYSDFQGEYQEFGSYPRTIYYEFRVFKDGMWSAYSEPIAVEWISLGKLDTPGVTLPDEIIAGGNIYAEIVPVRNAESYYATLYKYENGSRGDYIANYSASQSSLRFNLGGDKLREEGTYCLQVYAGGANHYESSETYECVFSTTGKADSPVTVTPTEAECYVGGTVSFHVAAEGATYFRYKRKGYSDYDGETKRGNNGEVDIPIRMTQDIGRSDFTESTYEFLFSAYINREWSPWTDPIPVTVKARTGLTAPTFHFEKNPVYLDEDVVMVFDDPEYTEWVYRYTRLDENGEERGGTSTTTPQSVVDGKAVFSQDSIRLSVGQMRFYISAAKNGDDWTPYGAGTLTVQTRGELHEPTVTYPQTIPAGEPLTITVTNVDENASRCYAYANYYSYTDNTTVEDGVYTFTWNANKLPESGSFKLKVYVEGNGYETVHLEYTIQVVAEEMSDWEYEETDSGLTITGYKGTDSDLTVPAEIDGKTVIAIGNYAFRNSEMNSIVLPDTVVSIGNYAFNNCNFLTSITLPQGLQIIGYYAFSSASLTEINLPNTLKTIGDNAFDIKAATIRIPDSVTSLGTIQVNGSLQNLYLPASLSQEALSIRAATDTTNTALKTLKIPEGVERITLENLKGLESIQFSDAVTSVSLTGLSSIETLTLPAQVETISSMSGMSALATLTIGDNTKNVYSSAFIGTAGLTDYSFVEQLNSIGSSAFYGSTGMTEVTFGSGITYIPASSFANCTNLRKAVIPATVTTIYDNESGSMFPAFYNDPLLEIWGERDSAAEKYANKFNIPFHVIGTEKEDPSILQVEGTIACECEPLQLYFRKINGATGYRATITGVIEVEPSLQEEGNNIFITVPAAQLKPGDIRCTAIAVFADGTETTGTFDLTVLPEFSTEDSEGGSCIVTAYNGLQRNITIPGEIGGKAVVDIQSSFAVYTTKNGKYSVLFDSITLPSSLRYTYQSGLGMVMNLCKQNGIRLNIPAGSSAHAGAILRNAVSVCTVTGEYPEEWQNAPEQITIGRTLFWENDPDRSISAYQIAETEGQKNAVHFERSTIDTKDAAGKQFTLYLCVSPRDGGSYSVLAPVTVQAVLPAAPVLKNLTGAEVSVEGTHIVEWENPSAATNLVMTVTNAEGETFYSTNCSTGDSGSVYLPELTALGTYTVTLTQDSGKDYENSVTGQFTAIAPKPPKLTAPVAGDIYPETRQTISWENPAELPTTVRVIHENDETPECTETIQSANTYSWSGANNLGQYTIEIVQSPGKAWEQKNQVVLTAVKFPAPKLTKPESGEIYPGRSLAIEWENPAQITPSTIRITREGDEEAEIETTATGTAYQWMGASNLGNYLIEVIQNPGKAWEQKDSVSLTVVDIPAPELTAPEAGEIHPETPINIAWDNPGGVDQTMVQITRNGDETPEVETTVSGTGYSWTGAQDLGEYQICILQNQGTLWEKSDSVTLKVVGYAAPELTAPEEGKIYAGTPLAVKWANPANLSKTLIRITHAGDEEPEVQATITSVNEYSWAGAQKAGRYLIEVIQNEGKNWEQKDSVTVTSVQPDPIEFENTPFIGSEEDVFEICWKGGADDMPFSVLVLKPDGSLLEQKQTNEKKLTLQGLTEIGEYQVIITQFSGTAAELSVQEKVILCPPYEGSPVLALVSDAGEDGFRIGDRLTVSATLTSGQGKYILLANGQQMTYYDGTVISGIASAEGAQLSFDTTILREGGTYQLQAVMANDKTNVSNILTVTLQAAGKLAKPTVAGEHIQSTQGAEENYLHFTIGTVENATTYVVQVRSVLNASVFAQKEFNAPEPVENGDGIQTIPDSFAISFGPWNRAGKYQVRVWAHAYGYDESDASEPLDIEVIDYAIHAKEIKPSGSGGGSSGSINVPDDWAGSYDTSYGISFQIMDQAFVGDETTGVRRNHPYVFPVDSRKQWNAIEDPIELPAGSVRKVYMILEDLDHPDSVLTYIDVQNFQDKEANLQYTFTQMGNYAMYMIGTVDNMAVSRSRYWYLRVAGPRLCINETEIGNEPVTVWTGETVRFAVEDDQAQDGTKATLLYQDEKQEQEAEFASGTISNKKAEIEYAFHRSGNKTIRAQVSGRKSVEHHLTVQSLGQLDPPAITCDPIQFVADGIYLSWQVVEHADGYVLHVRDESGDIYVLDMKTEDIAKDSNGDFCMTVPADQLKGAKAYELYMLDYGYQYDQNECSPITVQLVTENFIGFTMDKAEVYTGETVTFSIAAFNATKVQLYVDGRAYDTVEVTNNKATLNRAFTTSGDRRITFKPLYADNTWGDAAAEQTLIVKSMGQLGEVQVSAPECVIPGRDWRVGWNIVEHADHYILRIKNSDTGEQLLERDSRNYSGTDALETMGSIPSELTQTEMMLFIQVFALGDGYDQSEGAVYTRIGLPEIGITISPENPSGNEKEDVIITISFTPSCVGGIVAAPDGTETVLTSPTIDNIADKITYQFAANQIVSGNYTYQLTAIGQNYMAGKQATASFTVKFADTNKPEILSASTIPGTIWPEKAAKLEIKANQFTNKVEVWKVEGADETLLKVLGDDDADYLLTEPEISIFTYDMGAFEKPGDYKYRLIPLNVDGEWADGYPVTVTVTEPGKLPKPVITNLENGTILLEEPFTLRWREMSQRDMPEGVEFGGYFLQVYNVNDALDAPISVYPDKEQTSYELTGLGTGKTYYLELFAREKDKEPQAGNCAQREFSYRTIPDFAIKSIDHNGYTGTDVTVKWDAPKWPQNASYHPDAYVVWIYGPGLPYNEANGRNCKAEQLDGDATSFTLAGSNTLSAGAYSVEVYAMMSENNQFVCQKAAAGNGGFKIGQATISFSRDVTENSVTITGTVTGNVDYVKSDLLLDGKPVDGHMQKDQKVSNGRFVYSFPASMFSGSEAYQLNVTGFLDKYPGKAVTETYQETVSMRDGTITKVRIVGCGSLDPDNGIIAFAERQQFEVTAERKLDGVILTINGAKKEIGGENVKWNEEKKTLTFYATLTEGIHTVSVTTLDGTSGKEGQVASPTRTQEQQASTKEGCVIRRWPTTGTAGTAISANTEVKVRGKLGRWLYIQVDGRNYFVEKDLLLIDQEVQDNREMELEHPYYWYFETDDTNANLFVEGDNETLRNDLYMLVIGWYNEEGIFIQKPYMDASLILGMNQKADNPLRKKYSIEKDLHLEKGRLYYAGVVYIGETQSDEINETELKNSNKRLQENWKENVAYYYQFMYGGSGIESPKSKETVNIWKEKELIVRWWAEAQAKTYIVNVYSQNTLLTQAAISSSDIPSNQAIITYSFKLEENKNKRLKDLLEHEAVVELRVEVVVSEGR